MAKRIIDVKKIREPIKDLRDLKETAIAYTDNKEVPYTGKIRKVRQHEETDEERFNRCVREAKEIRLPRHLCRLKICNLALEACQIKRGGGGHWSGFKDVFTLEKFATAANIPYTTIHNWITIKTIIYDKVNVKYSEDFDWTIAKRTMSALRQAFGNEAVREVSNTKVTSEYERQLKINQDPYESQTRRMDAYISNISANLSTCTDPTILEQTRDELERLLSQCNGRLHILTQIRRRKP